MSSSGLTGRTETFVRYGVSRRLEVGFGYLWAVETLRPLINYRFVDETATRPSFTLGQMSDVSLGRQKVFASFGKTFKPGERFQLTTYLGLAKVYTGRDLELIGGVNAAFRRLALSVQYDGNDPHIGLTTQVARIRGTPVRAGVMAIRGTHLGPLVAASIPLGP